MERQKKHLSVLIVGPHPSVCRGLEAILNTSPFVGDVQIASYFTVQNYLESGSIPDVVLVDAVAEEDAHNATILALRKVAPQSHIIILTLAWSFSFEKQGRCVLLKSADTDDLMGLLQKIATESTLS